MGLKKSYLGYIEECIRNTIGELCGKRMLELGNQHILDSSVPEKTGKEYFINRAYEHTAVDLNGQDGALRVDLSKPINYPEWLGYFDVVTNAGTVEHIEPYKAQYECFKNIHNCLKIGGIAIHLLPDIHELEDKGCWKYHCNNYYSKEFVEMVAAQNKYHIVSLKIMDGMVFCCLQKKQNIAFMDNREEFLKYITRKKGGIVYFGINSCGIYIFYRFIMRVSYFIKHLSEIPRMIKRK